LTGTPKTWCGEKFYIEKGYNKLQPILIQRMTLLTIRRTWHPLVSI